MKLKLLAKIYCISLQLKDPNLRNQISNQTLKAITKGNLTHPLIKMWADHHKNPDQRKLERVLILK